MMTEQKTASDSAIAHDSISFAALPEGLVIIRVLGRGSFQNSVEFKRLTEGMFDRIQDSKTRFILDLRECGTMDSTFMGVLASTGLRQIKESGEKMAIVNANPQNIRLLETLGLAHFISVRPPPAGAPALDDERFTTAAHENVDRVDRTIHMIEAHQNLCDIDAQNNIRFQSVLKYLNESLKNESLKKDK